MFKKIIITFLVLLCVGGADIEYKIPIHHGFSGSVAMRIDGYTITPPIIDIQDLNHNFEQDYILSTKNQIQADNKGITVYKNAPKFILLSASDANGFSSLEPQGEDIVFSLVSENEPQHGNIKYFNKFVLMYKPNLNYVGNDSFEFMASTGSETSKATISIQVTEWSPPKGLHSPEFGLNELAPPRPEPWDQNMPTYCYVDNTHPGATNTHNPYGYPQKPRRSLPDTASLSPGAVVEIAGGGEYLVSGGPKVHRIRAQGSQDQPIFFRSSDLNNPPILSAIECKYDEPQYLIFENLIIGNSLFSGYPGFRTDDGAHHICIRNCVVKNVRSSGILITGDSHHIVVYNNIIHDNGDWLADYDQDHHGIQISIGKDIYILDNEMYHNSGNGLQINGSANDQNQRIWIGRNYSHHNKQAGLWTKYATDVVFSENVCYDAWPVGENPSSPGDGMGCQYNPKNVWFIFNKIHNCKYGIRFSTDEGFAGPGNGTDAYIVNNDIKNIYRKNKDVTGVYDTAPGSYAIAFWNCGMATKHVISNTIRDCGGGLQCDFVEETPIIFKSNALDQVSELAISISRPGPAAASIIVENALYPDMQYKWLYSTLTGLGELESASIHIYDNAESTDPQADTSASQDLESIYKELYGIGWN